MGGSGSLASVDERPLFVKAADALFGAWDPAARPTVGAASGATLIAVLGVLGVLQVVRARVNVVTRMKGL